MNAKFLNTTFEFLKESVYNATHKDAAKMLIGMGAVGFALSSLAQCFAIKINDKIDNKKKKFLLRQELADGAVNIGLFLALTRSVWKLSDKLLKNLGLLNIRNERGFLSKDAIKEVKVGGRIVTTTIASVLSCNVITPLIRNLIAGKITACKDKKEIIRNLDLTKSINKKNGTYFSNFDNWAVDAVNNYQLSVNKISPKYNCWNNFGSLKI